MQTIIICQGLPASGKSKWAREYQSTHLNFYHIEVSYYLKQVEPDYKKRFSKSAYKKAYQVADELLYNLVEMNKDVIYDDINLDPVRLEQIKNVIAQAMGTDPYDLQVKFFDVDVNEAVRRDAGRELGVKVGKNRIIDLWRMYLEPKPVVYRPSVVKPKAVIVDLDGTLATFWRKSPYDRDFADDDVNTTLLYLLDILYEKGFTILFTTGRSEEFESSTRKFLAQCGFTSNVQNWKLLMRETGDNRPDFEVKADLYRMEIEPEYSVMCAFDDRPQVKKLWVSLGIFVFDCNQHGVDF